MADYGEKPIWTTPGWTASEEDVSLYFVIFLSLLALVLILSKFLHSRPHVNAYLPEAGMTILVGLFAGALIHNFAPPVDYDDDSIASSNLYDGLLNFSATIFFVALLPPIVFNAGYNLRRELFFRYLRPIVLLAFCGTTISTLVVGLLLRLLVALGLTGGFEPSLAELLTFGALISTTDTVSILAVLEQKRVDPHLFYLVFGESALNDAVGLVLFNAFSKHVGLVEPDTMKAVAVSSLNVLFDFFTIFTGSLALGFFGGMGSALLFKMIDLRSRHLIELSVYILVMYFPFFLAEVLGLSGIVTIFFAGIAAKQYAMPNLSPSTENDADAIFRLTAFLAETIIFLEMGLSVCGLSGLGDLHYSFILWALIASLLGRACGVYPTAFFFNRAHKAERRAIVESLNDDNESAHSFHSRKTEGASQKPYVPDLKITNSNCHMLWLAGLRGAVAYACSKTFPNDNGNRAAFVATTMGVVLTTVLGMGGMTESSLKSLKVDMYVDENEYMKKQGKWIHKGWFYDFEKKYIFPCVLRNYIPPEPVGEDRDYKIFHELSHSYDEQCEVQSIEMTELSHLGIVQRIEMEKKRERAILLQESWKKRQSVYDYGYL